MTGYDGPAIVDPENVLAEDLRKKNLVNIAISDMKLRRYKHGMAQPAVLVIQQDGTVLYSWAIVPRLVSSFAPATNTILCLPCQAYCGSCSR